MIEWKAEWIQFAYQISLAGGTMEEAAAAINKKFRVNVTKNALIGKLHRLRKKDINGGGGKIPDIEEWKGKSIAYLIKAWKQGVSATEISVYYGVTRSTVRVKAKELGLPIRRASEIGRKNINYNKRAITPPKKIVRSDFPNDQALGLTFMELQSGQCKFPVGDGKVNDPFIFCGAPIPVGSPVPYCEKCKSVVYVPAYQKQRNKSQGVNNG